MRLVIVGRDPQGRSTVERVDQLERSPDVPVTELAIAEVWASAAVAGSTADRPRTPPLRPLACPVGEVSWRVVHHPANAHIGLHRTDTVDCDIVLEGGLELELEDGRITLVPGDLVVIPGLAHGWHAGPNGCTVSAVLVGIPA